jgi:DnaJ like chaperone protein
MGWLLGTGIGFIMAGPLGAVVGGALQHVLSGQSRPRTGTERIAAQGEQAFISNLVAIMTKICMADGNISDEERKTIHVFFSKSLGYHGAEIRFIDALMEETERVNPDLHEVCKAFDQFAVHEQRLLLLDLLYHIALVDHVLTEGEMKAIQVVVGSLGITPEEHDRIKSRYSQAKHQDHLATLGMNPSASNEEIKKAYRQLASQYHPDKVSHLGPELIQFSEKKFKEINEAYAALKKKRGIA